MQKFKPRESVIAILKQETETKAIEKAEGLWD